MELLNREIDYNHEITEIHVKAGIPGLPKNDKTTGTNKKRRKSPKYGNLRKSINIKSITTQSDRVR